jgi:hypothetical protein
MTGSARCSFMTPGLRRLSRSNLVRETEEQKPPLVGCSLGLYPPFTPGRTLTTLGRAAAGDCRLGGFGLGQPSKQPSNQATKQGSRMVVVVVVVVVVLAKY